MDQAAGKIYTVDTRGFAEGTLFASQPAPKDGDLPNAPGLTVVNTKTGIVPHVATDVPLLSPKGLSFVGFGDDDR